MCIRDSAPVQAEPNPVEEGQVGLFEHIGKALIETRLKYHAAGVDTGGVFLLAAPVSYTHL